MTKSKNKLLQGLIIGIIFGFLLQKGGVSKYDIIMGQLRLTDFTVVKIILTAIVVTMLGITLWSRFWNLRLLSWNYCWCNWKWIY